MKYLLLTEGAAYFPELLQPFERAGLYNWMKAFNGEVRLWGDIRKRKHELKQYDIVHINSYGEDAGLAAIVKPYLTPKTKLMVNMDLSIDYFDKDLNWDGFVADIHAADFLFSVEPCQVNLMNYVAHATKKKDIKWAKLMPHPVNMEMLKDKLWIPYNERMDVVAFQYHKYDAHWSIPKILLEELPNDYMSAMLGYIGNPLDLDGLRHMVMPYMEWNTYIKFLARCKVGLEYRTHKAASRFVMEAGALGIPVVTTHDSHMGKLIFPDICHPVGDFFGIRESLHKLTTDEEYRLQLARDGMDRLAVFNFENSKKRLLEMLKGTE